MAKKKSLNADSPEGDFLDSENELAFDAQSPTATRHHKIVTEYVEELPVTQLDTKPATDDDRIPDPPAASPAPVEPNEIESFLASLGGTDARYTMVIYRLPNYLKDGGRTHQNARVLCGTIEFTMDYEMEIQKRYARRSEVNIFMIVVRKNGQLYKHLPGIIVCEPPSRPDQIDIPPSVAGGSAVPQIIGLPYDDRPPSVQSPDPLQAVDQLIQIKTKLDRAFGVTNQPPQAPVPAVDPDTAILQFAMQNSSGFKERIGDAFAKKFFGDQGATQDKDEWAGVAMEVVKSGQAPAIIKELIDGLFRGFSGFLPQMGGSNGQAPTQPTQIPTMPDYENGIQKSGIQQDATISPPLITNSHQATQNTASNDSPEISYQKLIGEILTALQDNTDIVDAIRKTDAFLILHPQFSESIEATFSSDPDVLLGVIGQIPGAGHLPSLPHAKEWIIAYQAGFFREEQTHEIVN